MITVHQDALLAAINATREVAKSNAPNVLCQNIRLSASDGVLSVKATDMDNWITFDVPCEGDLAQVMVAVDLITEAVARIGAETLKIDQEDGSLTISGKGKGKRKIKTTPLDLPEPPSVAASETVLEVDALLSALDFCAPAIMPDEDTREPFKGVYLDRNQAVATNGNVVAVAGFGAGFDDLSVTLRRKTLSLLKHLPKGGQVSVSYDDRRAMFRWNSGSIIVQKVEGKFADYNRAIMDHANSLSVLASDIVSAVRAVSFVGQGEINSKSSRVVLVLAEAIEVTAASSKGSAEQPIDGIWNGQPMRVGFASKRVEQALMGFGGDEIEMAIGEQEQPIKITSKTRKDRLSVLMPIRLLGD